RPPRRRTHRPRPPRPPPRRARARQRGPARPRALPELPARRQGAARRGGRAAPGPRPVRAAPRAGARGGRRRAAARHALPGGHSDRPAPARGLRPRATAPPGARGALPRRAADGQGRRRPHRRRPAPARRARRPGAGLGLDVSGAARPVMLVVLDGFGLAPPGPGNAVDLARTPVFDAIWASGPRTTLEASGTAVGLPAGQMGNSEVGHMNIGAGRRVMQSLTYVQEQIDDGGFYENAVLREAYAAGRGGTLHLIGLVSDGGVHSDLPHLLALLELAARLGQPRVRVHVVTDGRDSAPDGSPAYVAAVERKLAEVAARGVDARIASVTGRYFAMDRDRRWDRTAVAYDAVVCGRAPHVAATAAEAISEAYARGETDEFIRPTVVGRAEPMRDGDAVVFFNFRADRARQLTYALTQEGFAGFRRCATPRVHFASLMEYDAELGLPFAFALPPLTKGLSEVVSAAGLRQYHTAETEKYAHVTYFFNLQREEPFPGEDRLLVPSPQVATYDLKPEMSAPELTDATVARI